MYIEYVLSGSYKHGKAVLNVYTCKLRHTELEIGLKIGRAFIDNRNNKIDYYWSLH